jgi:hypothetical protein
VAASLSPGSFEQFYRVSVGVFDLNLLSARADFHLVSEAHALRFEVGNARRQVLDEENYAIPTSRLLPTSIGHRP